MGFRDMLNSLADRVMGSAGGDDRGYDYGPYDDGTGVVYEDPAAYEEPPEEAPIDYEPSYSGGGYISAGARPAKQKGRAKPSLAERLRGEEPPRVQQPLREEAPIRQRAERQAYTTQAAPQGRGNVIPIHAGQEAYGYAAEEAQQEEHAASQAQPVQRQTVIFLVRRLEDAEEIITHMLDGGKVIINMEHLDEGLKRRMLDVISGAAYALEASIKRISVRNYFIAPFGEEIVSNVDTREQAQEEDRYGESGYGGYRAAPARNRRY